MHCAICEMVVRPAAVFGFLPDALYLVFSGKIHSLEHRTLIGPLAKEYPMLIQLLLASLVLAAAPAQPSLGSFKSTDMGKQTIFRLPGIYSDITGCPEFYVEASSQLDAVCRALGKARALSHTKIQWQWKAERCAEPGSMTLDSQGRVQKLSGKIEKIEVLDLLACE
jgi:hypothetical protein